MQTMISVKIPINWDALTAKKKRRLRQIIGRDTRVIRAHLGIIETHEKKLLRSKLKDRVEDTELQKLTMTALKVKKESPKRFIVPHDMKKRFPRTSVNEFAECRRTSTALYESYLSVRRKGRHPSRPCNTISSKRIPRWIYPNCFKLIEHHTTVAQWWLNLRDSFDTALSGRFRHDRLVIPLKTSPFHIVQLNRGTVKAAQIFTDINRKWWVTFAVKVSIQEDSLVPNIPYAVLAIDLGIKKAACSVLLTEKKVSETKYFAQREKVAVLEKYDCLIANLQHRFDNFKNSGKRYDSISRKLKTLKSKRMNVAKEYDRVFVRQLLDYINNLNQNYNLYVTIGRLKGIRSVARKGNGKGAQYRGIIHRWSFYRITQMLKHGLEQLGWVVEGKGARFKAIPEQWTSIKCWKCGRKGIRPKQSLFICHTCGFRTNADRNGALNIARRFITLIPSLNETGLGRWVLPERGSAPKAARTSKSKQKSKLSSKDDVSHLGESAVVHHAQMSLLDFGNKVKMGDNDPTVARTVEKLSVSGTDTSGIQQEKEARSVGEMQS